MVNVGLSYACPGCGRPIGLLPAPYFCPRAEANQPGHEPVARRTRPRPVRRAIAGVGESLDDIIRRLDNRERARHRRPLPENWDAATTTQRPEVETTWRGSAFPRRGRAGSAPTDRRL